jgi:hypothetical protein
MQSLGSGKRPNKGRVYGPAVLMLLIAAALACSRAMDDRDIERLQMAVPNRLLWLASWLCARAPGDSPGPLHRFGFE